MKLILHHFWKDVRTLRGILGLWLLIVLTQALATFLAVQPSYPVAHVAETIGASALWYMVNGAIWISVIVYLIQSEPVTGASSFWLTRPIPPLVSVLSKLIFILGLVILPGLAPRSIDLFLFGIPFREIGLYLLVAALFELMVMPCVVWLATYTRTMAQFWGVIGILFILLSASSIFFFTFAASVAFTPSQKSNPDLTASRVLMTLAVFFGGLIVSLIIQYGFRATRKAFLVGVGSLALSISIPFWWPFVLHPIGTVRLDVALAISFAGWIASLIIQSRLRAARKALLVGMGSTLLAIVFYFATPFVLHLFDRWFAPPSEDKPVHLTYQLDTTKPFAWSGTQFGNVTVAYQSGNGHSETQPVNVNFQSAKVPLIAPPPGADGTPVIHSITSSFQPNNGGKISLPESLDSSTYFGTDRLDWSSQLQLDNPGLAIEAAPAPANGPVPVFMLDSGLSGKLKDQTGTLDLKLSGDLVSLEKRAEIPLTGTGFARIPRALVRLIATQHDKNGIDLSVEEAGYVDVLKWQSFPTVYLLVDPSRRVGIILKKLPATSQSNNISGPSFTRMSSQLTLEAKTADLPQALPANFDGAGVNGWVLYIYEITSRRPFKSEVSVPGYTFHPGER